MSIKRNSIYNLLGTVLPIIASLIAIPIYLKTIGDARYGILSIVWLLLGYFGLFDIGLGRATAQRIAELRDGLSSDRAKVFWTALLINSGLGILGGLILWPIAYYLFSQVIKIN